MAFMEHSIIEKMLLIRRVEEEIIARYPKQLMRLPVHLSIGQEAIAVGACHHLNSGDSVFSTHRCHAHFLAKGGNLEKMILELHGKADGCNGGRGGSMHLQDVDVNVMSIPIVASAIPLAVGAALANKIDGNRNIVVCFFGDAAVEEGVFHESMNFASLMQLPIIFVCEDNSYSVDTHIKKRQPERELRWLAKAHHMAAFHFHKNHDDTRCVFKIAEHFKSFIDRARENNPIFVICDTQRSHVHCGMDKEFELEIDPIIGAINRSGLKDIEWQRMLQPIYDKITAAFDTAEAASLPTPDMASKYVYA
jgi:TPP-dependent pyruvate/acetoin dehydrogenase alpha subunit